MTLRHSLLASAALSALALGSTTAMRTAEAACSGTTTIVCTGSDLDGITSSQFNNMTVTIDPGASVSDSGTNMDLTVTRVGVAPTLTFNMNASNSSISGDGTQVQATLISLPGIGPPAQPGVATFNISGDITSTAGTGVLLTLGGTATMTIAGPGSISAASNAIDINNLALTGNTTVGNAGQIYGGTDGSGNGVNIRRLTGVGSITVNNTGMIGTAAQTTGGVAVNILAAELTGAGNNVVVTNAAAPLVNGSGTIHSTGNSINIVQGRGTTDVTNDASITSTGGMGVNILKLTAGNGGLTKMTNSATGTISSAGTGINVDQLIGNVTVENAGSIHSSAGDGIVVVTGGDAKVINSSSNSIVAATGGITEIANGNAEVDNRGGSIETTNEAGILAISGILSPTTKTTKIDATNSSVTSTNGPGIVGVAVNGSVTIDSDVVESGANNLSVGPITIPTLPVIPGLPFSLSGGVLGLAGGGDATVTAHGDITTDGQFGVLAFSIGGNATAESKAGITIDPPIGMASITVGNGVSAVPNNGTINSTVVGLLGINLGGGAVQIVNSDTGDVQASAGTGVLAIKTGPATNPIAVPFVGNFSVVVSNEGIINAPAGAGIGVIAADPSLAPVVNNVLVANVNGGSVTGAGGLLTAAVDVAADGNVLIANDSNSTMTNTALQAGLAIGALAGGDVAVFNTDNSDVVGRVGLVSVTGSVSLLNNGSSTWNSSGLNVFAADVDATITNDTDGTINMIGLGAANVMVAGRDVVINNDNGADFTLAGITGSLMGAGRDALINNSNNAVLNLAGINGTLMLAAQNATITNQTGAVINLTGINSLGFLAADSAVNNSSVINVTGLTTFAGLDNYNNAGGLHDMRNSISDYGLVDDIDYGNGVGDVTVMTGNFNGGAGSALGIDAFLGGPGSGSSSDQLWVGILDTGDVTGTTALLVNDTNPGAGSYNPTGIRFAHVEGDAPEGSFFLPGGPIDKGFFDYDILRVETSSSDWLLVSAPNDRAEELPAMITGAQTIWYESTGVWLDRTADLRRQLTTCSPADVAGLSAKAGGATVTAAADMGPDCTYKRYGMWFRGFGGEYDRNDGVEYDQDLWGGEAGIDFIVSDAGSDGGVFVVGALGGYLTSKMDFNERNDKADFEGGTVGAYATYLRGGWYADLLFKANILDVDYETSFDDPEADANTDAVSLGARLDAGYRFQMDSVFVEPQATLAYVSTDMDDYSLLATDVDPETGESLRGRLGLRIGASWDSGNMIFEPFLVGSLWHEFEGDNEVDLTSGASVSVSDDPQATFGEVGGGLNIMNPEGGMSFFAKVDAMVGGDIESISGKLGGRFDW